jgi:hypothetical protein
MDRSFFALKHFLLRIINGPEATQPARQAAARPSRAASRNQKPDVPDDWARIEL